MFYDFQFRYAANNFMRLRNLIIGVCGDRDDIHCNSNVNNYHTIELWSIGPLRPDRTFCTAIQLLQISNVKLNKRIIVGLEIVYSCSYVYRFWCRESFLYFLVFHKFKRLVFYPTLFLLQRLFVFPSSVFFHFIFNYVIVTRGNISVFRYVNFSL